MKVKRTTLYGDPVDSMHAGEVFECDGEVFIAIEQEVAGAVIIRRSRLDGTPSGKTDEFYWVVRLTDGELLGLDRRLKGKSLNGAFVENMD